MPRKQFIGSGYGSMWMFVMFDLPVKTKKERKIYAKFRKELLHDGFTMLQYSVYARYCVSEEIVAVHRRVVRKALPAEGHVRILVLTDRQFGKMENYVGKSQEPPEGAPQQLTFF